MRNCILLDVDGVLAPTGNFEHRNKSFWYRNTWVKNEGPFDMWFNTEMGAALSNLAVEVDADIVWCTSWLGMTQRLAQFAETLGITPITWPEFQYGTGSASRFKPMIACAVADSGQYQQIVWFDDDPYYKVHPKVKQVRTNGLIGLQPSNILKATKIFMEA